MELQSQHVFVDASGRRQVWLRRSGWTLSALIATYLLLLVVALVAPPGFSRLAVPGLRAVLPDAGAPLLGDGSGGTGSPQDVLEAPPASPPTGSPRSPDPDDTGGSGSGPGVPGPSAGSTTAPTAGPGRPPQSGAPAASATPPANRPTGPPGQSARPTDQATGKPTARPSRTARP